MTPHQPEDLHRHRVVQALAGGASHATVVFTTSRAKKAGGYESVAWRLAFDGDARDVRPQRVTAPAFPASSPALSPDGRRLAFLSKRGGGGRQVHVLAWAEGEAARLTSLDCTPSSVLEWTHDAAALLVLATEAVGDADGPHVVEHLPYKLDGSGVIVHQRTRLLRVDARTGRATRLVDGDFDVYSACASPDGARIAFVRDRTGPLRHRRDLWVADADGGHARQVTHDLPTVASPAWSPDGRRIAFGAGETEGASRMTLWCVDADGGDPRRVSHDELESGTTVTWHPDGDRVAVIILRRGLQQLAVVPLDGGDAHVVERGLEHVLALAPTRGRLVFAAASMRRACEVFSCDWDGGDAVRHSALNRGWMRKRPAPHVRKRRFVVPDGDGGRERIDAWLLLPPDAQPPYPLLVDLHGGPHSHVLIDYANHAYWYALLSRGWAIVAPNAVGSAGYGQDFAERLRGRWGELDLPQVLAVVDALQRDGLADGRVACAGKSYGGFLSAWAIGQSDRFRAAVVSAPVTNICSHAGTSDTGYYVSPYAMRTPFEDLTAITARLSPARHAPRARTPTLILQGDADERCPLSQAEELFTTLRYCTDVDVRMVVYPGGSHQLAAKGAPRLRADYHGRIVDWLERHAAGAAGAARETGGGDRDDATGHDDARRLAAS